MAGYGPGPRLTPLERFRGHKRPFGERPWAKRVEGKAHRRETRADRSGPWQAVQETVGPVT